MILSAIVAVADNNAIGRDNTLPWHLPDDLKFFKRTTLGKPMLMGRKTFESLGGILKNRLHIVVSRQKDLLLPEGVLLYDNIAEGIARMEQENTDEGFIIGGGVIFEETMHLLDRMYITKVHTTIADAHAFFPHTDHAHWKLVWEENHKADEKHTFSFTFQQLERIKQI
ncbi:MAG: dihydrofolate reductase [Bacteroidetes bacterium]|nr:dihydrofolate reductase [Bacteroidota bacterium]